MFERSKFSLKLICCSLFLVSIECQGFCQIPSHSTSRDNQAIFNEVWQITNDHFFDQNFCGKDWNGLKEKYRELAKNADSIESLAKITNMMLAELHTFRCRSSINAPCLPNLLPSSVRQNGDILRRNSRGLDEGVSSI
jgi:hypothetical protein